MLWEKVIVEESGWCWWWLVPAAEPPGSTVTLEWALRRTVPATAVSDLSMHNCVPTSNAMQVTLCRCVLNNQHRCFYVEVVEHWGSFLLHLPTKVEEGNAKWQSRSSLLSTSHLLSAQCACVHIFGTNRVCPLHQFLRLLCVPFCQHQVAVTFSLTPAQHPLSSSVATASLYLWPIQAKLLFLHYLIYAKSKHGSQPFQRQPFWHLDKKKLYQFCRPDLLPPPNSSCCLLMICGWQFFSGRALTVWWPSGK